MLLPDCFCNSLGAGGFGIVHEGMNVITGRLHAVKMVRKMRCLQSGTIKDPVQKEVEILKAQNHVSHVEPTVKQMHDGVLIRSRTL